MSTFVRVLRAFEGETVEIHWQCDDGAEVVQRVTVPPKAKRNAAGQVIERPETNASGQRYAARPGVTDPVRRV